MKKAKQTVLITGGTGLVGTQLVRSFAAQPDTVVLFTSRSSEKIAVVLADPSKAQVHGIQVDLESESSVSEILNYLQKHKLQPTVLINNARNVEHLKKASEPQVSRNKWMGEFLLDVVIPYELTMALAAEKNSQLQSVINISSIYGMVAQNPHLYDNPTSSITANYGVAKAALLHLTKELASQLAPAVRVNAVSYGGIVGKVDAAFQKRYSTFLPAGKMLELEQILGPVLFLADASSSAITGQNIVADGGWTIW